jgi:hypothetical protein
MQSRFVNRPQLSGDNLDQISDIHINSLEKGRFSAGLFVHIK